MDRALKRPWFGWGRYGRNRIYNPESGQDITISDGYWINLMGSYGLVACFAVFGLFALVVFRAARALRFIGSIREQIYLAALTLIVAINVINLVPNNSNSPWSWLLVGALLGRVEALYAAARQRVPPGESAAVIAMASTEPQFPADRTPAKF